MNDRGVWTLEEAHQSHFHSPELAVWLSYHLNKNRIINDLGCGLGYYAKYLKDKYFNVDAYEGTPQIESISFFKPIKEIDLTKPQIFNPGDCVCLEVGEHIPSEYEDVFLENVRAATVFMGRCVLSWAVPNQPGVGHVNCKPYDWVISKMNHFTLNEKLTKELRNINFEPCTWFKDTIFVFDRSY